MKPNWQTIDSAPRDGTDVLLWFPDFKQPIHVGHFVSTETREYGVAVRKYEYWYIGSFRVGDRPLPTHWMPLEPLGKPER